MNDPSHQPVASADSSNSASGGKQASTKTRQRRMARKPSARNTSGTLVAAAPEPEKRSRGESKIAGVITMLKREQGATLAELVEATGWLPHTTRAALTGLKKKGHVIAKASRDGTSVYQIEEAA